MCEKLQITRNRLFFKSSYHIASYHVFSKIHHIISTCLYCYFVWLFTTLWGNLLSMLSRFKAPITSSKTKSYKTFSSFVVFCFHSNLYYKAKRINGKKVQGKFSTRKKENKFRKKYLKKF